MTFARDQSPHQLISRGRLPHCSRRHDSFWTASIDRVAAPPPGGITPSTIMSPGPPGPSTEIRLGARAHNDPSLPVAATLRQPATNHLNPEAALDETLLDR